MADTIDTSVRLQSSMRTRLVKNTDHGTKVNKIELGRVTKVNYQTNSVGFVLGATNTDNGRGSANDTYSALLPMSMAGRNGYGKAYGNINPVNVGDIILVGFIDDKTFRPIVLGIYPDKAIINELTRNTRNDIDPSSVIDYAIANSSYKVYPDQTYDFHDGLGVRTLSFSGHSFLTVNPTVPTDSHIEHKTDDGVGALDYKDLNSSYFGNNELIEPISDKAPEIIFKHQGLVKDDDTKDTHALYLYIAPDGTYRISQMKTDEDWRTYFEIRNSEIHLVRQNNSKIFGGLDTTNLESSEVSINNDGSIMLRNHTVGLQIKSDGLYNLDGEKLITTKNAISDLILDKLGGLGFGGANMFSKSTSTLNMYVNSEGKQTPMLGALASDYIDCLGGNAYYTYAYSAKERLPDTITLCLTVYDSDKNFLEGKEHRGDSNIQIVTRALPQEASYLRVSISDSNIPIMLAYGSDYSNYQPSYLDNKAKQHKLDNSLEGTKQTYLDMQDLATQVLHEKTLDVTNIKESLEDNNISTTEKQVLNLYLTKASDNYDKDLINAFKYEINTEKYKQSYGVLVRRVSPILEDLSKATAIVGEQVVAAYEDYYNQRYDLYVHIVNAALGIYNNLLAKSNSAEIDKNNTVLKQFTNVTQSIQSIIQSTVWTVVTEDIDLNYETLTENILFKGTTIKNSAINGSQYIQVFSATPLKSTTTTAGITQRVWSISDITSYSRVLVDGVWSKWTLDSDNAEYNTQFNNVKNSINYVDSKVDNKFNDLTNETKSISQQIKDSSITVAQYKESNDKRVKDLESRAASLELRATGHDSSISGLTSRLGTLETKVTDNTNLLKNHDSAIDSNISRLNNIDSTVADIKSTLTSIQTAVKDLTTKQTTLETRINSINNDISSIKSRLTALESKSSPSGK